MKHAVPNEVERRQRARELAERALDEYAARNPREADRLAEQAATLHRGAVVELLREIDDGAPPPSSQHDVT